MSLFKNPHDVLIFAFNQTGATSAPNVLARLVKSDSARAAGSGSGLVGLDASAQAGMIRAGLMGGHKPLTRTEEAILICRFAPRFTPCACRSACCSGAKLNHEWRDSANFLIGEMEREIYAGTSACQKAKFAGIAHYFKRKGEKQKSLKQLADQLSYTEKTMAKYRKDAAKWLHAREAGAVERAHNIIADSGVVIADLPLAA